MKGLTVALLLSCGAMIPVWAADPVAAFAASVPVTFSAVASRFGLTEFNAGSQRHAFGVVDASGAPVVRNEDDQDTPAQVHREWMTLLSGIGLIGVLIGRAKRRYT
ncbi:MAG: hypothetical protein ACYCZL_02215 [Polaromonas sp.]